MESADASAGPGSLPIPPGGPGSAAFAHDWSETPLGPMESWPVSLKAVANVVLGSNVPMLIAWGPDLILIHNDSYGERILGTRRPALGKPLVEIWSDQWDLVGPNVEKVLGGQTIYHEAAPRLLHRLTGVETAWLTFCYNPVRDDEGEISGIFGIVTAIDGDTQTEERLRETEQRFRLIADSAPVPIWVTQLDRKRSFVNRAYVDFLAISYDDAVDFDWRTIIHSDDRERILAESIAGEASLKPFVLEGRYRDGHGRWRWLRSTSQPRWGPGGEHIGFIGVAHDVTEAKLAEQSLRELNETLERRVEERTADLRAALDRVQREISERERAQEALRQAQKMEAVGRLTGGIAHDFNNLLTPVIGGLEILAAGLDEPRMKRLAENALESSRRGAKLTTQLLAFSRIQRIGIASVDVNEVVGNLRQILTHTIGQDIEVRFALATEKVHALCDVNQLENAILNLAINARDAMPQGGTLTIATGIVSDTGGGDVEAGDYVRIEVADTGTGMTPEVAARATEPFFSTKASGQGTGLGLAQVYGIASQSGGTVRIETEEGAGTRISIVLPRVEPTVNADEAAGRATPAAPSAAGPRARIAVVDDDSDVRRFIVDLLEDLGHDVISFEDPEAAAAALAGAPPDLVLVDFAMPSMNGAELVARLRRIHPEIRIAFVTGYAESEQLERVAGRNLTVLRKPFGIDELSALVEGALSSGGTGD